MRLYGHILVLFSCLTASSQSIDYSNLQNHWNRCLKDSADTSNDIVFMNSSVLDADSCACKTRKGYHITLDELTYDFKPENELGIGVATGGWISADYVPDTVIVKTETRRDTIIKKIGDQITIEVQVDSISDIMPVLYNMLGPASTYSISTYQLNEKKNKLIIIDDRKPKYRVLELTERWMRLEPIN
jgi:hypothetical protein